MVLAANRAFMLLLGRASKISKLTVKELYWLLLYLNYRTFLDLFDKKIISWRIKVSSDPYVDTCIIPQ